MSMKQTEVQSGLTKDGGSVEWHVSDELPSNYLAVLVTVEYVVINPYDNCPEWIRGVTLAMREGRSNKWTVHLPKNIREHRIVAWAELPAPIEDSE